ncbi:MAG: low affinity iron permease family protein [Rhizobacter sp.]|nr:low affinity iron permease family protein [Chlorobiales bacterium]
MKKANFFTVFASKVARMTGHPAAFALALLVLLVWAASGPIFKFSDTWQLVINTGTTIITFLMVFIIQNSQNRDTQAMQIKLDELIRASAGAHDALLNLEELSEKELDALRKRYVKLGSKARKDLLEGLMDTSTSDLDPE